MFFYQFPVLKILVPLLYTRRHCCTHPDHDAPFQRDTCDRPRCKGPDRHQCFFSYLVVLVSVAGPRKCLEPVLEAIFPCSDPDSSRGVIVRNASHCLTLAVYDFDVTSGGGTGLLWWTAVVRTPHCDVGIRRQTSVDAGAEGRGVIRGCLLLHLRRRWRVAASKRSSTTPVLAARAETRCRRCGRAHCWS